ncbi:helix-turn-helix domain-containing protein [Stenotrophomonas mori]|uniref:Helix-turn-helix domain-containing protein n=1 Tax=Stenotrophomonas mori TaxID=2871096 RepID=A0ABT0SDQ3_9GAMM|nr:helix-turn-helix domain-containing protein [Stenotrophomonas mori]MCL7713203.1 helix-turn-helix domain-containing protein [Stenotrophomonas mori]
MTRTTADIIRELFPGRVVLTPAEVAEVIGQHVDHVRDRLLRGTLIPGLRKDGGRWRVPVADLAEAIDGLARPSPPPVLTRSQMASTASPTRRRRPLGPHFAAIHARTQR